MKNVLFFRILFIFIFSGVPFSKAAGSFVLPSGKTVVVSCHPSEEPVVQMAIGLLRRDLRAVLSDSMVLQGDIAGARIIVGTIGQNSLFLLMHLPVRELKGKKEAFLLQVLPDGRLLIAGSDKRGTAYGVMELSRLLGVSPWEWWADAVPSSLHEFRLPAGYRDLQSPSVEFRGIFINDEDWGFMPWASQTYEPSAVAGQIGPKTHERIFELLLRLKANAFWPAMHACSVPFYFTKGNQEVAEKYGIYVGTSHCEPMMRNPNGEWKHDGKGEYDFVNNRDAVLSFWEQREREVARDDNLYTLGIRGLHDGKMLGANTIAEQKAALEEVFKQQRRLLQNYVNQDLKKIPQMFVPYKELLEVYDAGLKVPDDVTLVWCDDNYGYIRRFPTPQERLRMGGNGIYYHISYWGRPHDYLWLGTTHPGLIFQQMKEAYDQGARKIWMLNVGDIKPAEYQIELFMDMAWNIRKVSRTGVESHLKKFLGREFGENIGARLLPLVQQHYRLAWIRKPEFLGNTRVEEKDPSWKVVKDLPWSEEEIRARLAACCYVSDGVERLSDSIPEGKKPAYFQLIQYPLQASAEMNKKLLVAQLARHGKADWAESDAAYDRILSLSHIYNAGKWNRMMDLRPRKLSVFEQVPRAFSADPLPLPKKTLFVFNGSEGCAGRAESCQGLGYEGKAVAVKRGDWVEFAFDGVTNDSVVVEVRLLPVHPVIGTKLCFSVSMDGQLPITVDYATQGRTEEWKENVLRNQAIRRVNFRLQDARKHKVRFEALDEGVVLDQIVIFPL